MGSSLVRELGPYMPHGVAKTKEKKLVQQNMTGSSALKGFHPESVALIKTFNHPESVFFMSVKHVVIITCFLGTPWQSSG